MPPAIVSAANQADANLAIARRLTEEGFSNGNLEVIEELSSPDCGERQHGNGPDATGAKRLVSTLRSWFSGFRLEIQNRVTHEDAWTRDRDRDQYRPLPGIRARRQDDRHHRVRRRAYRGTAQPGLPAAYRNPLVPACPATSGQKCDITRK